MREIKRWRQREMETKGVILTDQGLKRAIGRRILEKRLSGMERERDRDGGREMKGEMQ